MLENWLSLGSANGEIEVATAANRCVDLLNMLANIERGFSMSSSYNFMMLHHLTANGYALPGREGVGHTVDRCITMLEDANEPKVV